MQNIKIHLLNTDDHILDSLKKSDDYLGLNKKVAEDINRKLWISRSLLDIIPVTTENIMSGNLFPLMEAEVEFESSIQFCRLGFYKHANIALRNFLELGLLSVYYDIEDKSHIVIQNWLGSNEDTPYKKAVFKKLKENKNISIFDEKCKIFDKADNCYRLLSSFTHTKGYGFSSRRLSNSNVNYFNEESFNMWLESMTVVLSIVVAFHILKYPVALQNTPIDEKFGLNPPAGRFLNPNQVDNIRKIFKKEWIDVLQEISDNDPDAVGMAEWVNNQPDITEAEILKQIEEEQKYMLEMQGYEEWERRQNIWLNGLKDRKSSEYNAELEIINKVKEWARKNNMINKKKTIS